MARKIERIVIHCSDSPNGRTLFTGKPGDKNFTTPLQEIDLWHRVRGFRRLTEWRLLQEPSLTSIGYHFLIYVAGAVVSARHVDEIGAHAQGYNATSLGICLTQSAGSTTASTGTGGMTSNNVAITFPSPTASWGQVVEYCVFDAASAGNLLWRTALTAPKTINNGDAAPSFATGAATFQIDN